MSDRFFEKSRVASSGCWVWTAAAKAGYGVFRHPTGKQVLAHRYAWESIRGPIPEGLMVLHRCGVALCVRPSHLYLGTHAENMRDRDLHGRTVRGEADGNAKLTEEQVREIRARWTGERGQRGRLAAEYGVSPRTIYLVVTGETWVHVQ